VPVDPNRTTPLIPPPYPPAVTFRGRELTPEALAAQATAWCRQLPEGQGSHGRPVAFVMTNDPDAVALLFALSTLPAPLVVLPADPQGWPALPTLPAGTPAVLAPAHEALEPDARRVGLRPIVLPPAGSVPVSAGRTPSFFTTPGLALFTSGSTGQPRPVYRTTAALLGAARALLDAHGLGPGGGIVATLPLDRGFGMLRCLFAATVRRGRLGLLPRFDASAALELLSAGRHDYWPATPAMADLVARAPGSGAATAPRVCEVAGRLPARVARAFQERFGIPLRGTYGATEAGVVTVDPAPPGAVRLGTSGRVVPGAAIAIGDDPRSPLPAEEAGHIWTRCPWMMAGYGYPPELTPPEDVAGWWPTPDLGWLDHEGYLTLVGRRDDIVRTAAGHLVDLGQVAEVLETCPGAREAVAVALDGPAGPAIGALVEVDAPLGADDLRHHAAARLPAPARPRALEVTAALPRLASGKVDRRAAIAALAASAVAADPGRP
jgi:long-chain acyl-CoA synthetase